MSADTPDRANARFTPEATSVPFTGTDRCRRLRRPAARPRSFTGLLASWGRRVFAFSNTKSDSYWVLRARALGQEISNGKGSTSKQQGKEETQAIEKTDRSGGALRLNAGQDRAARAWQIAAKNVRAAASLPLRRGVPGRSAALPASPFRPRPDCQRASASGRVALPPRTAGFRHRRALAPMEKPDGTRCAFRSQTWRNLVRAEHGRDRPRLRTIAFDERNDGEWQRKEIGLRSPQEPDDK